MSKKVSGKTTFYWGGFQYEDKSLQFVPTPEGYYDFTKNKYIYNYTDHLGNIRLSYDKNLTIIEENNFYPFGLKHKGYNNSVGNSSYKYKFNGKEYQDDLGLNLYDYGARMFDPAIATAMQHDPLSEKH